jgi:methyl-accepting chemotaxis protein
MDFVRRLVPTTIRRRYAVKFGIALLILGVSVGLIGYVATAGITGQMEERVEADHASATEQEAQSLQMWNQQNEHTVEMIARSDVVASDDPDAIEQRFLDWEEHLDADTFDISYVDVENGTVTASTSEAFRGAPASDLENVPDGAYSNATQTVPWVSDAYLTESDLGRSTTVVTYVQLSAENEDRAIVYTADLEAYATDIQSDEGVTTMILDGDDEVMLDNVDYGGDHATFGQAYGGDGSLLQSARTEGATTERIASSSLNFETDAYGFGTDGSDEYIASSARVLGTDWVVVTYEPTERALGFVNTINDWGIIATILGVILIGMVGAVLGRNTAVSIDRLTAKAARMEEGNLDVDLETKRIDNIGRLYDGFDSMRVALREQIEEAEAARREAERERERVAEINDHLEEKAAEYCAVMGDAADGDLTARADADSENEQMQQIGEDFNEMLEEIERTVAQLGRFATDVATASEQVTASSEEVRSASQQVTESIQEISDGADRQNESLQSVNQEMSALSTTTEEIAASSNEVADIAERTVDMGREGQDAAQEAIAAMDEIETESTDAVTEMRRLEEEVQQIDELINTISEIARQTNMLALNANIEASRSASGSEDEGFSVVAKEVKALSEDVADAADEAEDRLEAIRERTEASAAEVEGTSADIENANEQVKEAVDALEEIAELAKETNVGVQEISAATEQQAASTQEVVAMVDDAATISDETSSEAENVAAAAEEQTTALTEVTKSASSLSEQAAQLSEALDRFDTDADPSELDLEATFDADLEATDPGFAAETDREGGITFDADDGPEGAESGDAPERDENEAIDLENGDEPIDLEGGDEPIDLEGGDEPIETDSDAPDDAVELDAGEPVGDEPSDGTEPMADDPAEEQADEIGADEILGLEGEDEESDAGPADPLADETDAPLADDATDGVADSPADDTTDPLADEADDPLADDGDAPDLFDDDFDVPTDAADGTDADPADDATGEFEPTDEPGTDAEPLGPVDEGDDALESGSADEEAADADAEETDADETDDRTDNDDVFTFGTTDDE